MYNYKVTFEEHFEDYSSFEECLKFFQAILVDLSNDKDMIPLYFNFDEYNKVEEEAHEQGYITRKQRDGQEL